MIGFPEDLERLGRREVQAFFGRHYGPQNLTIAVAGDVKPEAIRRLAERYWGPWRQAPGTLAPSACSGAAEEPLAAPAAPRRQWEYRDRSRAGPALMHAYYRPCVRHPDSLPLDLARWGGVGCWEHRAGSSRDCRAGVRRLGVPLTDGASDAPSRHPAALPLPPCAATCWRAPAPPDCTPPWSSRARR